MNLLINIKSLHSKTNILTYIEMIKQTVKNYKTINLFINKNFSLNFQKIVIIFKLIAMIVEILFILHVANGIHIQILV